LSRRTGINVKTLREYEVMGLIYTVGRSPGNYRLFDESALWCIEELEQLRQRIDEFKARHAAELDGVRDSGLIATDPRSRTRRA